MDPLVTIFETTTAFHAQLIKNALEAEGIPCMLAGIEQASTAALPGTVVQIQVPPIEAERAREIIKEHERPSQDAESSDAE